MSVIAILLLIMGVFENILPAFFVYIALGVNSNPRIPFVTQESPFVNESPVL